MNTVAVARAVRAARPEVMSAARDWVKEVVANPEVIDGAPDDHIVRFVDAEYKGGWQTFLDDREES